MTRHTTTMDVLGPWSLATSRRFWEGFAPASLQLQDEDAGIRSVFRVEVDWSRAEVHVTQRGDTAHLALTGDGDLAAAAEQTGRFLALDIDAQTWPAVGTRDPIVGDAQARLPGLRPCGFHSPYEAAAWSVLSQRITITQAGRFRDDLIARHGEQGAFPAPQALRHLDLDLPGRKTEYLHAVADAALDGQLDGRSLRAVEPDEALRSVQQVKGLGPFAAELVVIRGANAPDVVPRHESRLADEVSQLYGPDRDLTDIAEDWRPFRSWAAVHLRILREWRTREIGGASG